MLKAVRQPADSFWLSYGRSSMAELWSPKPPMGVRISPPVLNSFEKANWEIEKSPDFEIFNFKM
jgi:hypothetical protein